MHSAITYHAIVKGRMSEDVLWIDFHSKAEKWSFIKKHLPDIAKNIELLVASFDVMPPILQVKESWLSSLSDTQIHYPG